VLGQARRLRAEPLDLPPEDLDLLPSFGLRGLLRPDCSDHRRKAIINCRL